MTEQEHVVFTCKTHRKLAYHKLCQATCPDFDSCLEQTPTIFNKVAHLAYGKEYDFDTLALERKTAYIQCPIEHQFLHVEVCRMKCPDIKKCRAMSEYIGGVKK